MHPTVAQSLADAAEHHRQGRLAEAEAGYRRVLERAPSHPDALHRLGILARDTGHHAAAVDLIARAIAVDPRQPAYHNDAGIALHALGRVDDALTQFRHALSLAPDHVGAQNNLANILRERGEFEEALRIYRGALELRSDSPDLWYNFGNTLTDRRAFDEAANAYGRALALRPDFEVAQLSLGDALVALGRRDEALTHYARVLVVRESPQAITRFVDAFEAAELRAVDPIVRETALRALSVPWARPATLAGGCIRLLAGDGVRVDAASLLDDPLLRTLLESAPICDPALERVLTLKRRALLDAALRDDANDEALAFACTLARQCFIDDYVLSLDDDEFVRAAALRERIDEALRDGRLPSPIQVAVAAAYSPLHALSQAEALLAPTWPATLAALVAQQVREPFDERRLRSEIPRLTPVGDGVSAAVRAQYEEHPYPRWVKLPPPGIADDPDGAARALWAKCDRNASLDILVAGCGTGQESIEFAQAFPRGRVLAVDLSLASLAYAERKARELSVRNVEHAQADITRLALLDRRFDLISSVGVLHHLADPQEGLRVLATMLTQGGRMLVGLYSERGRDDVVAARAFIAGRGYRPTADDIRRCRQDLRANAPELAAQLARRGDFYATAECRDLLFHAQEHRFALSQIGALLDATGLAFDGFLLRPAIAARYASQYPADGAMTDLANWDRFEAQFPDAFAGMYIFWALKGP